MSLNSTLKLEVNTAAPRNLLRNPSGREGLYGWGGAGFVTISNSTSLASDSGYAFRADTVTTGGANPTRLRSQTFPVVAGKYLHLRFNVEVATTGTVGGTLSWYDAQGTPVGSDPVLPGSPIAANTPQTRTITGLVPAGASVARISLTPNIGTSGVVISKVQAVANKGAADPLDAFTPPNWVNILGKVNTINTEGGNVLEGVQDILTAGSLVATVLDPALDPAIASTLTKNRPVRLTSTTGGVVTPVWAGVIEDIDVDYDEGKTGASRPPRITLTATDDGRKLADAGVPFTTDGGFYVQIGRAASVVAVPNFDGTSSTVDSGSTIARDDSSKATDWIRRACNTYGGYAWIDGANRLQNRLITYMPSAPVLTVSDRFADVGALYYTKIGLNYGTRSVINALEVQRINLDETLDSGSRAYGPYVVPSSEHEFGRVTAPFEVTAGSPSALAAVILPIFATPKIYPRELAFNALDNLAGTLALTPYAPIRVKRTSPAYNEVVRVLRIRHEIRATADGDKWLTKVTTRPLETATPVTVVNPGAGADTGPGDVAGVGFPRLSSRTRTTTQSIPNNAATVLTFNAGTDDGIPYDAGTGRWTIPRAGRYLIVARAVFTANATGQRQVSIRIDGTSVSTAYDPAGANTQTVGPAVEAVRLNANQTIDVTAYQSSGAALNALAGCAGQVIYVGP